ncbi:aldehyde dehydrogenase family protein [Afifella sp. IM 167]|uniref:aldehyde dehydrogenase family protein n=1 Tax=Afifella sp. IM 167 TaxID=2033586 RepID=UPI001CCE6A71|nr:aldehyde dehydrogenase family protein [Afifella sp. IM 167]MBZ8135184.1 aldehyde dehydrogenase [Afifella sp. IM 167]
MTAVKDILKTMEYGPAPESDAPVREWLAEHESGFSHFIGGDFTPPAKGRFFETKNPANGEVLARIAEGSAADVDEAVRAAQKAFAKWSGLSGHVRARYLYALARLVQKRARFFAVLESLDNGKPIRESRDIDVPLVARHFYHHAGWAELIESEFAGHGPLGVCGQIIPWNFPLLMLAWKVAPALAAGNTVVLKPAEQTPLTALAFAGLAAEAGLPAGVLNIVTGAAKTGAMLVEHDGVDKLAFTGSTEVGRAIRTASAGTGKKLSLELGGKSPFIVCDDADLDSAVEGVVDSIWFNQGEVCCAGSRLLVQEAVAERFHAKLRRRMETLRLGDPLDKTTDIGPIVDAAQLERIKGLVETGCREGAECWQPSAKLPKGGHFFPPTILSGVAPASTVAQEEIFGPVLVSMTFRTPDEAARLANNSRYGLAASIWSENINLALDLAAKIKAGVVWVNATNLFDAAAGFGGMKESGFGREGGREGMFEYLKPLGGGPAKKPVKLPAPDFSVAPAFPPAPMKVDTPKLDRTAKLYVGGRQARPDSGHSYTIRNPRGHEVGQAGLGSRKDIRNAVEAAHKASGWSAMSGHQRAQVLYYLAENLEARREEFAARLEAMCGGGKKAAGEEVDLSVRRIAFYAAHADKYDGRVHSTMARHVTLAMNEPFGVMGILCPDNAPLLGFVSLVLPAIALGNRVVAVPSSLWPLAATDFYQVLDTSDVPGGVVNIVTGATDELAATIGGHDDIAAAWHFAGGEGIGNFERAAAGNLKPTWLADGRAIDWRDAAAGQGRGFLRHASQVKNIWIPYGE